MKMNSQSKFYIIGGAAFLLVLLVIAGYLGKETPSTNGKVAHAPHHGGKSADTHFLTNPPEAPSLPTAITAENSATGVRQNFPVPVSENVATGHSASPVSSSYLQTHSSAGSGSTGSGNVTRSSGGSSSSGTASSSQSLQQSGSGYFAQTAANAALPPSALSGGGGAAPAATPAPGNSLVIPAALADANSALNFTPQQQAAADQIASNFLDQVGGGNGNSSDPAYVKQWQTAQQAADDAYRATFGTSAFLAQNVKAAQQAAASNQ